MISVNQIQISDPRREKLIKLGASLLSDSLLELAQQHDDAHDMVERLISTEEQNVLRFKNKLSALKSRKEFVEWKETRAYRIKLESILDDLKAANVDPHTGVELMAMFYENDLAMIENCDNSSGTINYVFSSYARDLFAYYAGQCTDKEWIKDIILRLYESDSYGTRSSLLEKVTAYLPEKTIRSLIEYLWQLADKQNKKDFSDRGFIITIQSISKQLKDPALLEKTWRAIEGEGKLSTVATIEIAQIYFDIGDAKTSLSWLENIVDIESYRASNYDNLLFDVHSKLNNPKEMADIAWRMFRSSRSKDSLNRLLSVIGEDEADRVINEETAIIHKDKGLDYLDARFLVECEKLEDAERYILERASQLSDGIYSYLLELAKVFENNKQLLVATVIYRSLLDSILSRAQSKAYHHGIDYLNKLNSIAAEIVNWENFISHNDYINGIKYNHRRKSSFWAQYAAID